MAPSVLGLCSPQCPPAAALALPAGEPRGAAVTAELVFTGHFPPRSSHPVPPCPCRSPQRGAACRGVTVTVTIKPLAAHPWRHLLQARRSPLPAPSPSPGQKQCPCPRLALCPPLSPACPLPAPDTPGLPPRWPGIIAQWKDAPSIDLQSNLIGLWRIVFTPSRA